MAPPIVLDGDKKLKSERNQSNSPTKSSTTIPERNVDKPLSELWVIHGRRYDLEDFVDRHPGGKEMILLGKGRECTELFESYHAMLGLKPHQLLSKYEVQKDQPDIKERQHDLFEWKNTPFYDTLKERVKEHFKVTGVSYKCTASKWVENVVFSALTLISLYYWWYGHWWSLIGIPVFMWLGPGYLLHHGGHFSLTSSPLLNKFFNYCGGVLCSPTTWHMQHNIGHHSYTNIEGSDPDLTHFQQLGNGTPGYRLHKNQPILDKYKNYMLTMSFQANFAIFGISIINEPIYYTGEKYIGMHNRIPMTQYDYACHIVGRVSIFALLVVSPFFRFGFFKAIFFGLVPYFLLGCIFFVFSQVSHLNEHCFHPQVLQKGEKKREWAMHQVLTTSDYATRSYLWGVLSIGLNNQVPHHCFPAVDASHYIDLLPIFERTCKEFNVEYTTFPNWSSIFSKHFDYVSSLNDPKFLHRD